MKREIPTYNRGSAESMSWLRSVLKSMLEISPLSYHQKQKTTRLLQKMPDWLMANWAGSLDIDHQKDSAECPEMPEAVKSDYFREQAQRYLESHDAVPAGFCLDQLCRRVIRLSQAGRLPFDADVVVRQVCALALAGCTKDGQDFVKAAGEVLEDSDNPNHPIVDYHLAFERGETDKLDQLDSLLTGGRYGAWIDARLDEARRYLGTDTPVFRLNAAERIPQWDALWEIILKGGDTD